MASNGQQPKVRRITIYLEENDYNRLRASLILKGMTVSEWVRVVIKSFLVKQDTV